MNKQVKNKFASILKIATLIVLSITLVCTYIYTRNTTNYIANQNKFTILDYTIQLEEDFTISVTNLSN